MPAAMMPRALQAWSVVVHALDTYGRALTLGDTEAVALSTARHGGKFGTCQHSRVGVRMREQASLRISWGRETGFATDGEILTFKFGGM